MFRLDFEKNPPESRRAATSQFRQVFRLILKIKFSPGRPSRLLNARATNSAGDENDRQVSILARVPVDSAVRFHQPTSHTPVSDKSDSALEFTISKLKHILFWGGVARFFILLIVIRG